MVIKMNFDSQIQLYRELKPVFLVKRRLNNYYKYEVSDIDIWKYLSLNKWRGSSDLTLSMMVNDIITLDIRRVYEQEKV